MDKLTEAVVLAEAINAANRPVSGCFKTFIFIAGAIFAFLILVVWLLG